MNINNIHNKADSTFLNLQIQFNRIRRFLKQPNDASDLSNILDYSKDNFKRHEIKYECDPYQQINMLQYLGPWFVAYPTRFINSVYYDTSDLMFFQHNEEGIVPRIKLRMRWYGEEYYYNSTSMFEIKVTYDNYRKKLIFKSKDYYKIINKLNYSNIPFTSLIPISVVKYKRKYYRNSKNIRLTVDKPIYYSKFNNVTDNCAWLKDTSYVFEFKTNSDLHSELIMQNIPYQNTKFSKYARSVEFLGIL